MRTFGLALRAVSVTPAVSVEQAFEQAIQEWKAAKLSDRRAVARGFTLTRQRDVTGADGRLIEYLADQKADHEGSWKTLLRVFQPPSEEAWLTFEMSLEDMAQAFAPPVYQVQPPRFLRSLGKELSLKTADGWAVPKRALEVSDSASVNDLANEILDPERIVPLVVATEPVYATPAVKDLGRALADHVFGLARVVHVGPKLTWSLTARLGKELSVFDGGVRIYWPRLDQAAPPQRHPLILRHAIEKAGPNARRWVCEAVAEKLIPVTTSRYREPEPLRAALRRIDSEALEAAQLSQIELTDKITELTKERDLEREALQVAYSDVQKLEVERRDLEAALEQERREVHKWRSQYESLWSKLRERGEAPPPPPKDEDEALAQARKAFVETLILPPDLTIETDLGPDLYDALSAMHEAVLQERSGKMGDRRKAFNDLFGKHLNHPARYEPGPTNLKYKGKEECKHRVHLKSGKHQDTESIYWLERGDVVKRQYLVIRIGRHAP